MVATAYIGISTKLWERKKEMLLNELPKNTVGFNDKIEFEKKFTYEKTVDIIDDSKFIRFSRYEAPAS